MTSIKIDECYTLAQRDMKYTLVHATKRVSAHAIAKAMDILEQETGIKRVNIFGYNDFSAGSEIMEHPGMKLIIEHVNKQSPLFEYWLEAGDIRSYKRGLLNRFLLSVDLNHMSRIQLLNYIRDFKHSTEQASSEREEQLLQTQTDLSNAEAELTRKSEKIKELKRLRVDDQKEMDEMEQELNARMDRIKALKIENKTLKSLLQ